MRTEAKLWFWGLKDIIILAIALTISVVSWAKLNFCWICMKQEN